MEVCRERGAYTCGRRRAVRDWKHRIGCDSRVLPVVLLSAIDGRDPTAALTIAKVAMAHFEVM